MKSSRRGFIQMVGAGASVLAVGTGTMSSGSSAFGAARGEQDGPVLLIGDNIALADTSGANRFMPPQKPKPWSDILPAVWWGNTAPQNMDNRYANKYASFRDHWNYDDVSEDCLRINIFTPGINDGQRRPVMFWIHGGGYTNGNGIEQDGYNGENFARLGNVVFCSINHRLGPLGYVNLAGAADDR